MTSDQTSGMIIADMRQRLGLEQSAQAKGSQ
jgi:hypothetical protein